MTERIVALKREEAQAVPYLDVPYDELLDEYDPGATTKSIALSVRRFVVPS